jgi:hypothetical protein
MQGLEGMLFGLLDFLLPSDVLRSTSLDVIYEQRERVFHRDIQTRENNVRKHEREARVFSFIVFECLDVPVRHELELFIWLLK